MKTKIEIKSVFGNRVLFEFEKEDNTLKETLVEAVKHDASLYGADLRDADLLGADLSGANLRDADLRDADILGADLSDANLIGADLSGANLRGADLRGANLYGADLSGANLRGADLSGANLRGADLRDADLLGADLRSAYLGDVGRMSFIPFSCPSDGAFIGWKKITHYKENYIGVFLVKLQIPEDARRCSSTGIKCRCDKALVLDIIRIEDGTKFDTITNTNEKECVYRVGEMVYPDSFDEDRWNECSHGIHFFINKQSVIDYNE